MDSHLRKQIWDSMLQADQEQRYWHAKACQYVDWDSRTKIFLALVTSSTVASWAIWKNADLLWQSLTVAATVISIVLPLMKLNDKVLQMSELHGKWRQLMHEYEELWRDQQILVEADARVKLSNAKKLEAELSTKAITLPGRDKRLGELTYTAVSKERTA